MLRFGTDYNTAFAPDMYVESHYNVTKLKDGFNKVYLSNFLNFWIDTFQKGDVSGDSLLELSTGPNVIPTTCASRRFKHIFWSEFSAANREALNAWRQGEKTAYDWTPFFNFLADREQAGNLSDQPSCAISIEDRIRKAVQDVYACDLLQDPPITTTAPLAPFDCVLTSGALESACPDRESYERSVASIARLLKPGGTVLVHGFLHENYYAVGEEKFWVLPLDLAFVNKTFSNAGFTDITISDYLNENIDHYDAAGYFFLRAIKQ